MSSKVSIIKPSPCTDRGLITVCHRATYIRKKPGTQCRSADSTGSVPSLRLSEQPALPCSKESGESILFRVSSPAKKYMAY